MTTKADISQSRVPASDRSINWLVGILKITRWTLVVMLVIVAVGAVWGPEASLTLGGDPLDPENQGRTAYFGVFYDDETTRAAFLADSMIALGFGVFGIYAITQILKIMGNIVAGAPFARENGSFLRRIGFAGAAAQLFVYGVWIVAGVVAVTTNTQFTGMTVQLSPAPWIGVLIAFSLATIFRQGTELKEEQDLTV